MDLKKLTSEELTALFEREKLRRELTESMAGLIERAKAAGFNMREIMPEVAPLSMGERKYAVGTKSAEIARMLNEGKTVRQIKAALEMANSGAIYEAAKRRGMRIEKGRLARMS